ncbi:Uncharacterized conserved protein, contains Zn finger domain [Amycolatopsis xylanica]|uniref:Uncharacterized conserved protein, contains Zn finger domain n=1 Tax=Amycolatopsis xylanica TaxID=589385 RepID=A0A1H2V9T0_9PSEU|nr:SWIM zinc finger family protein [Amycolatopsis xylanica]SDW65030.1 Uncharacterized conserved protein, contains Zn finger domain [Amycolatopsis xylanica]
MNDRVRGFPAFGVVKRGAGRFARSWWGQAWIKAMEDSALALDPLKRGRRFAYAGRVGTITVSPGRLSATVDGSPDGLFQTRVTLARLSDADWERFLDRVAARASHLAALLDKDMPRDLVSAAEDAGVELLPGIGDLEPECDCPGWELPCEHAAALCYQVSWLLDADPFVLLLLRGRGERELLDALNLRNAPPVQRRGVSGEVAYARELPPLPEPLGAGVFTPVELPPGPEVAPLVANAAEQARRLLAGEPALDLRQDTVRLAASDAGLRARYPELDRAAVAWSYGGLAAVKTLESPWTPPKQAQARATAVLEADGHVVEVSRNRFTLADRDLQLRLGRDERWYPYRDHDGEWWPAGPPADLPTLLATHA